MQNKLHTRWTKADEAYLRKHYPTVHDVKELEKPLKRTYTQIVYKANYIGLFRVDRSAKLRFQWTDEMLNFMRDNYDTLTNKQIADALGLRLHFVRDQLYRMGLKRMELEYWTDEQVKFLRENYKKMGDTELAEIFNARWKKLKPWTIKHIDKKRGYLGLRRTMKQLIEIEQRNLDQGRLNTRKNKRKSNFLTTGPAKQKETRLYKTITGIIEVRVRIGKKWLRWPRWKWEQHRGKVPRGMVVVFKDKNHFNTTLSNLELITRSESTRRYAGNASKNLSFNYVRKICHLKTHNCVQR